MNKILSISIAGYNIESFIDECVGSLVKCSAIDDLEIIIVNDGSKDGTVAKANEYKEKYPNSIVVVDKENGGWGSTLNAGMKAATGKYYKQLDGDDRYDADNLAKLIAVMKQSDADIIFTDYETFDDATGKRKDVEPVKFFRDDKLHKVSEISNQEIIAMHTLAVKTELLQKNNVTITEKCFYTDVEFVLKSLNISDTFIVCPFVIYQYRLDRAGQSVSVEGMRKHYTDHLKAFQVDIDFVEKEAKPEIKELLRHRVEAMMRYQYKIFMVLEPNKEHKKIVKDFDRMIKMEHPAFYNKVGKRIKALRFMNFAFYKAIVNYTIKQIR